MRYLSVCSGIEAASVAWHPLGWQPVAFSEIDPFPSAVLAHHYPSVPNWGDMTRFEEWPDADVDLLVGGTPCFPAGTMIATARGFVPIEAVQCGDLALTHKGRFRRVLRSGSKIAPTVVVKGQGHFGMVTTDNHRFLARKKTSRGTRIDGRAIRISDSGCPEWIEAGQLTGHHWACVATWPEMKPEWVEVRGREKPIGLDDLSLMELAGAYLGDGWSRVTARRGYVFLGLNAEKLERLRPILEQLNAFTVSEMATSIRVQVSSRPLARWLSEQFGEGAAGKRVPMWALGAPAPLRAALLRGYLATDGHQVKPGMWRGTTVSRELALSLRALGASLGYAASVHQSARPKTHEIQGREVNQRHTFTVTFTSSSRSSFEADGIRWQLVRSVCPTERRERVFDLEVEEDHSYVADGICVHNCQDYSIAGQRLGMAGSRGQLTLTYVEILARYRPRWFLWENVPGVFSSNGGRDFARFLGELSGQTLSVPDGGWKNSGIVSGIGDAYGLAWCVRDAQFVRTRRFSGAVPQRRRRVFVVGYLGDWRPAAAVFFDAASLRGDPPPSRKPGQGPAPTLAARTRGGGGLGTDLDLDGGLIPEVANPLTARMHKGVNTTMDEEQTMLAQPIAFDCKGSEAQVDESGATPTLRAMGHAGSHANAGGQLAVAHALRGEGFDASEDGTGRGTPIVPVAVAFQDRFRGDDGRGYDRPPPTSEGVCGTLETVKPWQIAVAFDAQAGGNTGLAIGEEVAGTLHGGGSHGGRAAVATRWAVRRLTPVECERLQGFPDGYTDVPYRRRNYTPDGPRYKALGNSMAVNAMEWIGQRIALVNDLIGGS